MSPLPRTRPTRKYDVEAAHVGSPYSHAVMFHHFHDSKHPAGQGSLSADQFRLMLDWISERYCILSADEYIYRLYKHSLQQTDICLTFDDGLLCQAEVAAPILRENNIQAFFFIYSAPFVAKTPDSETLVEIYRYFRTTMFETVDDFYQEFMSLARDFFESLYIVAEKEYSPQKFLPEYPFYTENDKWFRYLRDQSLKKERYDLVMSFLMKEKNFNSQLALTKLWMSNSHLVALRDEGHVVGLHSFSHPTMLHEMSAGEQEYEYKSNMVHLREILGDDPISMSHPCGRYNDDTLRILFKLGIKIGFLSNTGVVRVTSNLEVPRRDHSIVWAAMQE